MTLVNATLVSAAFVSAALVSAALVSAALVRVVMTGRLVRASEISDSMQCLFITSGYRPPLAWSSCIRSILIIHNETINIWTHLLGFCYFFWLFMDNIMKNQEHILNSCDLLAVMIQLLTYQISMILSSAFHTFSCHSSATQAMCLQADHAGIIIALSGTYFRAISTIFRCFPGPALFHMIIISILFSLAVYRKYWRKPQARQDSVSGTDISLFLSLGLYAVVPFLHWIILSNTLVVNTITGEMVFWMIFPYIIGSLGVVFYVSKIPESVLPSGCVDIVGASHQIWHICIFVGMASWYHILTWVIISTFQHCQLIGDS